MTLNEADCSGHVGVCPTPARIIEVHEMIAAQLAEAAASKKKS